MLDSTIKRTVMRSFTYGMYVVGVRAGDTSNVFTANWITQVAFEPPTVAISVEHDAFSLDLIRASGVFAISVLRADQKEVAMTLGRAYRKTPEKVDAYPLESAPSGCPTLPSAIGYVDCQVTGEMPAGDHVVFLAEVTSVGQFGEPGDPLVMRAAGFKYAG